MVIKISSDYSDMHKELDRIAGMPDIPMTNNLNAVLKLGFENAQGLVHIDTGRLKASGKSSSRRNKGDWKGQFSFPAKNSEGVSYGEYERERGGGHDFFAGIGLLRPLFIAAIKKGLKK